MSEEASKKGCVDNFLWNVGSMVGLSVGFIYGYLQDPTSPIANGLAYGLVFGFIVGILARLAPALILFGLVALVIAVLKKFQ